MRGPARHTELADAGQRPHWEVDAQLPEPNEKAALQGSGTPNEDNPYLTLDALAVTIYACSSGLTLTTSYQDVAGLTTGAFTPTFNEYALVSVGMSYDQSGGTNPCNAADALTMALDVNGADEADVGVVAAVAATGLVQCWRWWRITLTADTAYTIKVQAKNATGARGAGATESQMMVWRLPR